MVNPEYTTSFVEIRPGPSATTTVTGSQSVDEAFGVVRGEDMLKVRLLFSKRVATYTRERVWHPSQEIVERLNGDLVLRVETAGWKELVRWILSWQPDVKVLSPKKLRDRVNEKMREALEDLSPLS